MTQENQAVPKKSASEEPVSEEPLIRIRSLSKSFTKNGVEQVVLDKVDFDIDRGRFLVILGESGCGKTTFLNIMGAIDEPDSGEIHIEPYGDILKLKDKQLSAYRNQMIGHVFQTFNLKKNYTVYENVRVPLLFREISRREAHQRIIEAAEAVGLTPKLKHRPAELSEGQAQRVAIARAIVNRPAILLADEPTGNLDTKTSAMIIDLLLKINRKKNTAVIMVAHDPSVVSRVHNVVVLEDGKFDERDKL